MTAYYNEIDPHAALWLRTLIKVAAIGDGDGDTYYGVFLTGALGEGVMDAIGMENVRMGDNQVED
jgi:hypothetical protein